MLTVDLEQVAEQVAAHWAQLKALTLSLKGQPLSGVKDVESRLNFVVEHLERLRQLDLLLMARSSAFTAKLAQVFVTDDVSLGLIGDPDDKDKSRCNFIYAHLRQTRAIIARALHRRLTPEETETVVRELVASRRHALAALRALELFTLAHLQMLKFEKLERLWAEVAGEEGLLSAETVAAMAATSSSSPSWGTRAFKSKLFHFARLIKAVVEEEEKIVEEEEAEAAAEAEVNGSGSSPKKTPLKKEKTQLGTFYHLDSPAKALTLNSFEQEIGLFEGQHVEMAAKLRKFPSYWILFTSTYTSFFAGLAKVKLDNGSEVLLSEAPVAGSLAEHQQTFEHILTALQCLALVVPSAYALFNLPALLQSGGGVAERMVLGAVGTAALLQALKLLLGNARQNFFLGSEREARIGGLKAAYRAAFAELNRLEALATEVEKTAAQVQEVATALEATTFGKMPEERVW